MKANVDSFLNYMTVERGVSPNTLAAYRNDLYQLTEFIESRSGNSNGGANWSNVSYEDISDYVLHLHALGYSDTTRARTAQTTQIDTLPVAAAGRLVQALLPTLALDSRLPALDSLRIDLLFSLRRLLNLSS